MSTLPGKIASLLSFSVDGQVVDAETVNARVFTRASEGGTVTFVMKREGGAMEWVAGFTALQYETIWALLFSKRGQTIPIVIRPDGNATPTVAQPHWTGNVQVTLPEGDIFGGEADTDRHQVAVEWVFVNEPTKKTS